LNKWFQRKGDLLLAAVNRRVFSTGIATEPRSNSANVPTLTKAVMPMETNPDKFNLLGVEVKAAHCSSAQTAVDVVFQTDVLGLRPVPRGPSENKIFPFFGPR
jgi:hypothetical protein